MAEYETHDYDVLVIGAGGAGLRAAIEASAKGVKTALVCKSLLGKAHTVMAEGGIAAALGNVWTEDNWKVHFRDTMRGGKFLNDWRMAELHAQEAPERVLELEEWGAVFDRTKDGLILQRNFGGHRYARLAHVGDRTGLEMIRTLQEHGVARASTSTWSARSQRCSRTAIASRARSATGARAVARASSRAKAVVLATGGVGKAARSRRTRGSTPATASRMALDAGAELIDMEFTQFHPTGMVWPPSVRGILVTEGVRGDGGMLKNTKGERFMFNYIPEFFRAGDGRHRGGGRRAGTRTRTQPPHAGAAHARRGRARDQRRGQGRPRLAARRRLPRHRVAPRRPTTSSSNCRRCTTSSRSWPTSTSPRSRWRSARRCHYIMGGVRVDADTTADDACPGLFAAGECAAGLHGANRLGGNSLSDLLVFGRRAGDGAAEYAKRRYAPSQRVDDGRGRARGERACSRRSTTSTRRRKPVRDPRRARGRACRTSSASSARRPSSQQAV